VLSLDALMTDSDVAKVVKPVTGLVIKSFRNAPYFSVIAQR